MNAIILAAGLGSRFKEVTKNNHKALLPIDGIPNIERTIQYLKERNINDITIVTGHMAHLFDNLKHRYGCRLLYNEHYKDFNNRYSMLLALPYLQDTYVIDADVVLFRNIFIEESKQSFYYTIQRKPEGVKEWCPIVNEAGNVIEMKITKESLPSMLGISYWTKTDSDHIREVYLDYADVNQLKESKYYWDDIPVALLSQLHVGVKEIIFEDAAEMDTVENYEEICYRFQNNDCQF